MCRSNLALTVLYVPKSGIYCLVCAELSGLNCLVCAEFSGLNCLVCAELSGLNCLVCAEFSGPSCVLLLWPSLWCMCRIRRMDLTGFYVPFAEWSNTEEAEESGRVDLDGVTTARDALGPERVLRP